MTNYYCYILINDSIEHNNRTYTGFTVDPVKRLRQHNQQIKGGAKYTKIFGNKKWRFLAIISGFMSKSNALQCEWRLKHPDGCKNIARKYKGKNGKLNSINYVLFLDKWTSRSEILNTKCKYTLYLDDEYKDFINVPNNVDIIYCPDIYNHFTDIFLKYK